MNNVETIQSIYAAFGRGDIQYIVDHVAENVDWTHQATSAKELPWYGDFSGRGKLAGFFSAVAEHLDITEFAPQEFMNNGNHVAVRIRVGAVARKSGKPANFDTMHFWTFGPDGLVSAYRHFDDTAAVLAAWRD